MKFLHILASSVIATVGLAPWVPAADGNRLLQCVPAGTPIVGHVKSYAATLQAWEHLPYTKLWAEPEV